MNALRQALLELPEDAVAAGVDALALGSNPRLARVARSLLDEDDRPRALRVGLAALERLGAFEDAPLLSLLDHPDDRIASLAAASLARGEPKEIAPALAPLLDRPGVAMAAARSLAMRGAEVGPAFLRQTVARGNAPGATDDDVRAGGAAARLLALVGAARDETALAQAALHAPDTADGDGTIEALADHGAPSFVPLLAQILTSASSASATREDRVLAASRAIERLTGVAAERVPSEPWRVDVDAQVARAEALRAPLGATRIRRGKKLDATTSLAELVAPTTLTGARRRAALGHAFLIGRPLDLDTEGWVARQLEVLRAAQAASPKGGGAA